MSDIWLTQTAAQVAVQRALTNTTTAEVRHGTVTAVDNGLFIHEITMDADSVTIRAHDVTNLGVGIGDRVTVLFAPPHQALIIGSPRHDPWHIVGANGEVGFVAGWQNHSSSGNLDTTALPKCMFRRDGTIVHVRGTAEKVSGGNAIWNMPVGYRPRNNLRFNGLNSLGGAVPVTVTQDGFIFAEAGTTPLLIPNVAFTIL